MMKFIQLRGSAQERGAQHGQLMAREIAQAIDFYQQHFCLQGEKLWQRIAQIKEKIYQLSPDYITEMDAIAISAKVEPEWIYALNARSELVQGDTSECSTLMYPRQALIGQTWDWAQPLESLIFIAKVELPQGLELLMMLEPGMLGKIGMNSRGLGICLNMLPANQPLTGLPIHILMRALLECSDLNQAQDLLSRCGTGKSGHIALLDANNKAIAVECAPTELFYPEIGPSVYVHTNHYLFSGQAEPLDPLCSKTRLATLQEQTLQEEQSIGSIKRILSHQQGDYPVLRPYRNTPLLGQAGTLATLIMNLKEKQLQVRAGYNPETPFISYGF